jgi:hypothetical protein
VLKLLVYVSSSDGDLTVEMRVCVVCIRSWFALDTLPSCEDPSNVVDGVMTLGIASS